MHVVWMLTVFRFSGDVEAGFHRLGVSVDVNGDALDVAVWPGSGFN